MKPFKEFNESLMDSFKQPIGVDKLEEDVKMSDKDLQLND